MLNKHVMQIGKSREFALADKQPVAHRLTRSRAKGFSLLEIMIAIGVLGIGLIMVAAIFPVALSQHSFADLEALRGKMQIPSRLLLDEYRYGGNDGADRDKHHRECRNRHCDECTRGQIFFARQPGRRPAAADPPPRKRQGPAQRRAG